MAFPKRKPYLGSATTTRSGKPKPKNLQASAQQQAGQHFEFNGNKYRSPLEKYTARRLHELGIVHFYETLKVPLRPKFTYPAPCWEVQTFSKDKVKTTAFRLVSDSVRAAVYTPDFTSHDTLEECQWVLEVKGHLTEAAQLRWLQSKWVFHQNGCAPLMMMPKNQQQVEHCLQLIQALQQTKQQAA